jgi:hypothetical protein
MVLWSLLYLVAEFLVATTSEAKLLSWVLSSLDQRFTERHKVYSILAKVFVWLSHRLLSRYFYTLTEPLVCLSQSQVTYLQIRDWWLFYL